MKNNLVIIDSGDSSEKGGNAKQKLIIIAFAAILILLAIMYILNIFLTKRIRDWTILFDFQVLKYNEFQEENIKIDFLHFLIANLWMPAILQ